MERLWLGQKKYTIKRSFNENINHLRGNSDIKWNGWEGSSTKVEGLWVRARTLIQISEWVTKLSFSKNVLKKEGEMLNNRYLRQGVWLHAIVSLSASPKHWASSTMVFSEFTQDCVRICSPPPHVALHSLHSFMYDHVAKMVLKFWLRRMRWRLSVYSVISENINYGGTPTFDEEQNQYKVEVFEWEHAKLPQMIILFDNWQIYKKDGGVRNYFYLRQEGFSLQAFILLSASPILCA